jgi:hypothetical protein
MQALMHESEMALYYNKLEIRCPEGKIPPFRMITLIDLRGGLFWGLPIPDQTPGFPGCSGPLTESSSSICRDQEKA